MVRKNNDYFALITRQTACCVRAAALLEEILCHFRAEELPTYRQQMHELERQADGIQHDILTRLVTEFITPIDQEDILRLVQLIDDITDALDEVILELYMYHMTAIPADAPALCALVRRCVDTLHQAAGELKSYKKPEALRRLLVQVKSIETEADQRYTEAVHRLFAAPAADGRVLLGAKAVYERLEDCCDLCEHAADVIEQVIIRNT